MTTTTPSKAVEKIAMTMADVIASVGLCRSTIDRLRCTGEFPAPRRIRGRLLWSAQDVRDWFERQPKEERA